MLEQPLDSDAAAVTCAICGAPTRGFGIKERYELYRCRRCSHVFVWPFPKNFRDVYSDDYFNGATAGFGYSDYDRDKEPMIPVFEDYLDRIGDACGCTGSVLDIGAATGFFLDLARRRGWKVKGVEASNYAAAVAQSKGLEVHAGILTEAGFAPESFDVVTMWDVIEHMDDPGSALAETARLLRPKGVLAINTPDAGSLLARILGTRWHQVVPPEHLNLFSSQSLQLLLERHGFEVLYVTKIGKRFTLQYIVQVVSNVFLPAAERIAGWLRDKPAGLWSFSINLRDNVFLLARKR